jgi:DNA polymerase elongation subunit (family B)
LKTEYLLIGGGEYGNRKAVIYTDQLREDGTIFYGSVRGFRPYFYVPEDSHIPYDDSRITGSEPGHVSIFGEKLTRVYTMIPNDVPQVREMFSKHYEADILFPWRYRIDKGYVNKENVRFFVDIEVSMGTKFLKGSFTHPIICLTAYDNRSKVYHTFVWRGDLRKIDDTLIIKERIADKVNEHKNLNVVIHKFSTEKEMMNAFCMYFVSVNPDVVTSWNTSFDYPYIINRMHTIGMDPSALSPIKFVGIDKFDGEAIIKGRYVLDLLQAYKKIHIGQLESFKLDDVGMFEFNVPKIKFTETFEELWKQKLQMLIEYNIADLEICVKLDEKKKIMDFFEGISTFTGAPLDECLANSRILDFYFLREAYKRGLRMPSANKDALPPNFEGAIVKEPIKGLHKNVVCLDLTALYPSIIQAGNMSMETLDSAGDIKFGNGVSFKSEPLGFIPSLIQGFLDRRKKIKNEMMDEFGKNGNTNKYEVLDAQQNVTKFLVNSAYGILGFYKSRYFVEDIAKTITYVGREINLFTQKVVEDYDFIVVAGDTDSVYISLPDEYSLDGCIKKGYELQDILNKRYADFALRYGIKNMTFEIKFEKIFSIALFCKKKRYVGKLSWKEGKLYDEAKYGALYDIVGFSSRRSDSSRFTKEFLKELYKLILGEVGKVNIYDFIRKKVEEFKRVDVEEIAIPKNFTKEFNLYQGGSANSVFINSSKMCNKMYGMDIGGGSKVLFVYAKTGPGGFCWMRGDSQILEKEGIKVDYEMMLERGIYMQLPTLFDALDMSVEDLKSGTSQTKLEQWV